MLQKLHDKLKKEVYDAGNYFKILDNESESAYQVESISELKAESDVFIIDHAISFRYEELRALLEANPKITDRLDSILKYWDKKIKIPGVSPPAKAQKLMTEIEYQGIANPLNCDINPDCVALSLFGNKISDLEAVHALLSKFSKLKILWLNENPVAENPALRQMVEKEFPNIEMLNSKFTRHATSWAFLCATLHYDLDKVQ